MHCICLLWEQGVAGSNPVAPTRLSNACCPPASVFFWGKAASSDSHPLVTGILPLFTRQTVSSRFPRALPHSVPPGHAGTCARIMASSPSFPRLILISSMPVAQALFLRQDCCYADIREIWPTDRSMPALKQGKPKPRNDASAYGRMPRPVLKDMPATCPPCRTARPLLPLHPRQERTRHRRQ